MEYDIPNIQVRGKSGVRGNLVVAVNVQWTKFTAKSEFQMMTTKHGFILKSEFKKIWWPLNMVSVLNLDSQKYSLHQTFLCQKQWPCTAHWVQCALQIWALSHSTHLPHQSHLISSAHWLSTHHILWCTIVQYTFYTIVCTITQGHWEHLEHKLGCASVVTTSWVEHSHTGMHWRGL